MDKEETVPMFDWGLYGLLVRKARMDMGYRKAEDFAASIYRRTRVKVSRDSLYKIEQGRQIPDGNQFMAINMALIGSPFYPWITDMCFSNEWKQIMDSVENDNGEVTYDIPYDWKQQNTVAVVDAWKNEENPAFPYDESYCNSKEMIANHVNDDSSLFVDDAVIPF